MPEPVVILTGEIHSGKTSRLLKWSKSRTDVYGILSPVISGKRVFQDISSGECFSMEAGDEKDAIVVGRYRFNKNSFEKAIAILDANISSRGWLVIDEIGPLELRGEGFAPLIKKIVTERAGGVLFVVRESLVKDVAEHFGLLPLKPQIIDSNRELPL